MTRHLIVRMAAEADITEAAIWYENQLAGLGEQFLGEIATALHSALMRPRQFPCLRRKPEVRRILLARFPYRIFFVVRTDAVIVFRILHVGRDDREWKDDISRG